MYEESQKVEEVKYTIYFHEMNMKETKNSSKVECAIHFYEMCIKAKKHLEGQMGHTFS
jgi:hypothetical protein